MQSKLFFLLGLLTVQLAYADKVATTNTPSVIPWDQIGARAGADYQGEGLTVRPSGPGARLHCLFQRLEGEATAGGLWLTSTVTNTASDRFRVMALEVGRQAASALDFQAPPGCVPVAATGSVAIAGQRVSFNRPGLNRNNLFIILRDRPMRKVKIS